MRRAAILRERRASEIDFDDAEQERRSLCRAPLHHHLALSPPRCSRRAHVLRVARSPPYWWWSQHLRLPSWYCPSFLLCHSWVHGVRAPSATEDASCLLVFRALWRRRRKTSLGDEFHSPVHSVELCFVTLLPFQ